MSVVQDVLCCSVLQYVAVCCSMLQCISHVCMNVCGPRCIVLQCVAVCCSVLQCVAVHIARVNGCLWTEMSGMRHVALV